MMLRLVVENLGLIERAELEPAAGLNVLSGETGAGKTMLAQAIGLLAGTQPPAAVIGPHGEEAYVEAEFELADGLLDDPALAAVSELRPGGEPTLVVARRLLASGRSRALVWGRTCARSDLEALAERLVEVSSQHEARRLARPAHQLALLDGHAGLGDELEQMSEAWRGLRVARAGLEQAREQAAGADRRREELEQLVERVEALDLAPGERASLEEERTRLQHLDELTAAAAGAAELVNPEDGEGALAMAARAAELAAGGERFEPRLAGVAAELRDASVRLQEAGIELRAYLEELDADPARLEAVEARLLAVAELERRYGEPLERVQEQAAEARAALELVAGRSEALARLEAEVREAEEHAAARAERLSAARAAAAEPFAAAVQDNLAELGMPEARFTVELSAAELGPRGADRIELRLAANPGLPSGPLAQVGSGGELSRIALAIRVAARGRGGPPTLLLDEVDAGVGGRTARAVGELLQRLSGDAQVLCITHLPQIASLADAHFRVEKRSGDPSVTEISRLEGDAVTDELARMLGGDETDRAARRHAEALRAS